MGATYEAALFETLLGGGDTDTNACIVGGLIGAACGAGAIPDGLKEPVLSCDTLDGVHHRPEWLHSKQIPDLVKNLIGGENFPKIRRGISINVNGDLSETWNEFLQDLQNDILPIYSDHERSFDSYGIHGKMHICRCVLFAEFMLRYYYAYTPFKPDVMIRYAVAFHDSGRRGNGVDVWESDSAQRCSQYLRKRDFPENIAEATGSLIPKHGGQWWRLEKRIVHDADILDIMRPCCGHGGRQGFREEALHFLGVQDDPKIRDVKIRSALIEDAWDLIEATEEKELEFRYSSNYMADVLEVLNTMESLPRLLWRFLQGL